MWNAEASNWDFAEKHLGVNRASGLLELLGRRKNMESGAASATAEGSAVWNKLWNTESEGRLTAYFVD